MDYSPAGRVRNTLLRSVVHGVGDDLSLIHILTGGFIGIVLGWLISRVAGSAIDLVTVVDAGTVILATGFAIGVGVVFGLYPAWRAAGLRPIEALRYE